MVLLDVSKGSITSEEDKTRPFGRFWESVTLWKKLFVEWKFDAGFFALGQAGNIGFMAQDDEDAQ